MKKLIGIVIASMMFANIGYAEMKRIEDKEIRVGIYTRMATVCVDGYKFVVSYNSSQMISMVQFFERAGGVSLPAKC
tara:strand:- start:356 stop:586 length:231 start_codon:yes stop_codon:yes gene_type:complete